MHFGAASVSPRASLHAKDPELRPCKTKSHFKLLHAGILQIHQILSCNTWKENEMLYHNEISNYHATVVSNGQLHIIT